MKKKLTVIYCLIIILFTTFCKSEKNTTQALLKVSIGTNMNNRKKIYLSQFLDNIRYVPLENNINHLLSWTYSDKFEISEKHILFSDTRIIILYDKNGHFIKQIGKMGRGPGEYSGIDRVYLTNDHIYVHDFYTDDLIEYNLDGAFIKNWKSGFLADDKYRLENDAVFINDSMIFGNIDNRLGNEKYKALIIDRKGEIKYAYKNFINFKLDEGIPMVKTPEESIIHRFDNKFYFKELYNDTLFQLDDQYRLKPVCVLELGKFGEPFSLRGKDWSHKDLDSYIYLTNVYQTKDYLFLECDFNKYSPARRESPLIIKTPTGKDYVQWYNYKGQYILGVYDKKNGDLVFSEPTSTNNPLYTTGLYNDIDAGPKFYPWKMVNDSTMVMNIRFDQLLEYVSSSDFKNSIPKYPERKKRLESFVDSLQKAEFDNPILMFATFNK